MPVLEVLARSWRTISTRADISHGLSRSMRLYARASRDGFQQFGGLYFEGAGERHDVQERDVALAALDSAHVVPMEIG